MNTQDSILLHRLARCIERLLTEYKLNAPAVIKKTEISIINDICNKLSIKLVIGE